MAVQAQWNLESSSNSALFIARGILQAATSDNVQPLAILACERFGSTIAICQETCRKIETSVLPTPSPVTIQFLKAAVGYSANDCATQLGKSQAGVQFLGLASAMVTTMGCYNSSIALHDMLKSSAADKTLLPTTRQLKDLLEALEHRCQLSSFADNALGWSIFLSSALRVEGHRREAIHRPSEKAIGSMIEAFRQLSKVGQFTVKTVTITAPSIVIPWIVAFTKWCIGIPPTLLLRSGASVLDQPDSNVIVIASPKPAIMNARDFEVRIQHTIPSLDELLLSQNANRIMNGMVTMPYYGQWTLLEFGFDAGFSSRVLNQALPHALKQVILLLRFCDHGRDQSETTEEVDEGHQSETTEEVDEGHGPCSLQNSAFSFIPFQDDQAITRTASLFLNREFIMETNQPNELLVEDLPLVKLHFETLDRSCRCEKCAQRRCMEGTFFSGQCEREQFLGKLAAITARILTISLFHFPESLQVLLLSYHETGLFVRSIQEILRTKEPVHLGLDCVLESILMLVGHNHRKTPSAGRAVTVKDDLVEDWVASSFKGQVVFPTVFETFQIQKRGYFALSWLPGLLRYGEITYPQVRSGDGMYRPQVDPIAEQRKPATRPCNLAPSMRTVWNVEVADEYLLAELALQDTTTGGIVRTMSSPGHLFHNLTRSLMLESCPHDSTARLNVEDRLAIYTGPINPWNKQESGVVCVVAVDGADDLRTFAMSDESWTHGMVARRNSCLNCCLDLCRSVGARTLVL